MAVKETIAIIGSANKVYFSLAKTLASGTHLLLLIGNNVTEFENLVLDIAREIPNAEIEILDCVKNACWEADIVFLEGSKNIDGHFTEKIAQVSAQKPVVYLSDNAACVSVSVQKVKELEQLLPNSIVLQLLYNKNTHEMALLGADEEAKASVKRILGIA